MRRTVFLCLFALPAASAFAQETTTPDVTVRQLSPIAFGKFTYNAGGAIVVDPRSGACLAQGGAVLIRPECSAAVIELRGQPGDQVAVQLQPEAPMDNTDKGGGQLFLKNFTMNRDNPVVLGPDGSALVQIGATLGATGQVNSGSFSGSFSVETITLK